MAKPEQEKPAEKQLGKVLEKLEKLDIREWAYEAGPLVAEKYGLKFRLGCEWLYVMSTTGNLWFIEYNTNNIKNKPLKKMLKQFYETTCTALKEHQKKELEERLDSFLSN